MILNIQFLCITYKLDKINAKRSYENNVNLEFNEYKLNSEHFCRFILDKYKIKYININFKFQRVRANLKLDIRDKRDLKV